MTGGIITFPSVMDIYDIHDNGKALLLVMVQDCKKMVLDYMLNMGSVGMSHIWIELEGSYEVVTPLPGTTRSLPTWYWYILPHQLDDRRVRVLLWV